MAKKISVLSFVLSSIRPFAPYIFIQMIVGILWAIDLSLRPYIIRAILNKSTVIPREAAFSELGPYALLYMGIGVAMLVLFRLHDWAWLRLSAPLRKHVATVMMDRMMLQSYHFYQNNFSGALSNKVNDVMMNVPTLLKIFLDAFYSHGISVLVAIYALSAIANHFAVGMAVWVAVFIFISCSFSMKGAKLADQAASKRTSLVGYVVDILTNMMTLRLFGGRKTEERHLNESLQSYVDSDQRMKWFYILIYTLQGISFSVFQAVCFWWLITGFQEDTITPGDFALILNINIAIVNNLWYLSKDIKDFSEAYGSVSQGLSVMSDPIEVKDKKDAPDLVVKGGSIVFDRVQFNFKDTLPFFQDKSVVIPSGQKVGLVGYSGSGKSTFVNLILRFFEVTSGHILIDGQDINQVTQDSLRRAIAFIPQEPTLFHRSLMDNIRYGRQNATNEEVIEAAKQAHAHDFIMAQRDGYNTIVGERGGRLSGGQRQRVVIARAFLKKDASILVLDEATSSLDALTELLVNDSLGHLMASRTTIVIAHRLVTLLQMDRILVFNDGKIVEDGSHSSLLLQRGLYAKLWQAQVNGLLPSHQEHDTVNVD
jgi:ATP-binding cassette, subfamily B, bacterial